MNKTKVFEVGLKLFGLYYLIKGLFSVVRIFTNAYMLQAEGLYKSTELYTLQSLTNLYNIPTILDTIFLFVIGVVLIKKASQLANKLLPATSEKILNSKEDILTIAIAYVGVGTIVGNLVYVVNNIPNFFMYASTGDGFVKLLGYLMPLASLIDLLIGLVLLMKAPQIASFLYKRFIYRFWD